jgi:hypothetical protein
MKITTENQNILKRIETSQPTYDHRNWDVEYSKNIEYMKNISEYQYKPSTPSLGSRPNTSDGRRSRPSSKGG